MLSPKTGRVKERVIADRRWTPGRGGTYVPVGQYTQAAGNLEGISRRTGNQVRQAADP